MLLPPVSLIAGESRGSAPHETTDVDLEGLGKKLFRGL